MPKCPICARDVAPRAENPVFPFCTPRCKTIDLGKWVNEEYRVPADDVDVDDVEEPSRSKRESATEDMRH